MVRPIIDKRRKRKNLPQPRPEWVEAFLILLLHKTGGALTVSMKTLENFGKLKKDNKTLISFDLDNQSVTIRAPGEVKRVFVPKLI